MVSIIKNQLLKHLSRFTKNLSPDKVNLSTFRGEGELSNLQLDENVLTELLELPSWLRLTSAWCNHVSFRITWTKLKSTPITLSLDEVNITVETCETRSGEGTPTTPGLSGLAAPMGKYSFIHKVIDGITVTVNTVNVKFKSPAFTASVQMSRIRVESRTPKWLAGDLRLTRLKDPNKGLILIFKELSWQTVRIEASSTQDKTLTPLRLLTNQARCRITIKKKLADCSILASRLVLILDDLLWVLTDSQLKAALHFVDSLSGLIQESTKTTQRAKAQRKLETLPEYQAQLAQATRSTGTTQQQQTAVQKMFAIFDVRETSYHFFSQRIDLHLCDDNGPGRSSYPALKDGGALQISIQGFQIDFYPYHLAKADRSHWPKYKEASVPPALWLEQSLNSFKESLLNLSHPNRPSSHPSLERTSNLQQKHHPGSSGFQPQTHHSGQSTPSTPTAHSVVSSPMKKHILDNVSKLMSACVIMKIEEFTLYRVTTSGSKQMPKEFISGDRDRYSLPPDMPTLHAEFTYFYYPGDFVFPLPPSKAFIHINPVQINFHLDSCLWFSSFALNLHESLLRTSTLNSPTNSTTNTFTNDQQPSFMYMDVKVEVIMPRIVFEANPNAPQQRDRPKCMQVQISRLALTNIREMGASRADLAQAISSLQEGSLVFGTEFPAKEGDLCIVTDRLLSHIAATDTSTPLTPIIGASSFNPLSRYALWSEPRDVWCMKLDPVWIDFLGARSIGSNRSIPFVDAVPVTIWLHGKSEQENRLPDEMFNDVSSQEKSNSIKSSDSLILSVNNFKQSLELDSCNLFDYPIPSEISVQYSKFHNVYSDSSLLNTNGFIEDNVKKKPTVRQSATNANEQAVDSDNNDSQEADLHIIAHVSNLVSVQIDHYQFLFLLRLAEELAEMATFLQLDSKRILQEAHVDKSIIIGCVIPQVEVSLIMPSQTPGKESSGGDGESVVPDSASLGDDLNINSSGWNSSLDQPKNTNVFGSEETPSPVTYEPPSDFVHQQTPNTHGHNVQIQSVPTTTTSGIASASTSSSSAPYLPSSSSKQKGRNSVVENPFSKELNSGLSSMKKGFSQFMTSIDSALKTNISDDMSDTLSVQSDLSSDSENYVLVISETDKTTDCMDMMFRLNPFTNDTNTKNTPIEMASEVCEDPYLTNMSSPSEPSESNSFKRRDLVSMVTFRLTTVELIRQNIGNASSVRLQVTAVNCNECGAIPWDEFQTGHHKTKTKFGTRCRAWNIASHNPEAPPKIAIRLEEHLTLPKDISNVTDKNAILNWFKRMIHVKIKDLDLNLSMSTVIGLGDLAEDEVIPAPIPMDIELDNVRLNLIEDRPPVNITSPGPVPVNLQIGKMYITRDETGVFFIQPKENEATTTFNHSQSNLFDNTRKERDREVLSLQLVMQQLKMDNENLKRQMNTNEKLSESNRIKIKQENDLLKTYLKAAQDDVSTLLDEKRTLMDTIRSLQNQLTSQDISYNGQGQR